MSCPAGTRICKRCEKPRPIDYFPLTHSRRARKRVCRSCKGASRKRRWRWHKYGRPCPKCHELRRCPEEISDAERTGIACEVCQAEVTRKRCTQWARMKRASDPVYRKRESEAVLRWRAAHPEQARAAAARFQYRLRTDPKLRARNNETRRIAARLRREREGRPIEPVPVEKYRNGNGKTPYPPGQRTVPVAPLVPYVLEWLGPSYGHAVDNGNGHRRNGAALYQAGIMQLGELANTNPRTIYAILHGERQRIALDTADALCTVVGAPFGMVFA